MNSSSETIKSCWTCKYQKITSADTFLGKCSAPAQNNPDLNKPIPPEIVDKGCKKWIQRVLISVRIQKERL